MWRALVWIGVAGCGRIGFADLVATNDAALDGRRSDGGSTHTTVTILTNTGTDFTTGTVLTGSAPAGIAAADVDGDGKLVVPPGIGTSVHRVQVQVDVNVAYRFGSRGSRAATSPT
jgi:hypothetical protein